MYVISRDNYLPEYFTYNSLFLNTLRENLFWGGVALPIVVIPHGSTEAGVPLKRLKTKDCPESPRPDSQPGLPQEEWDAQPIAKFAR